MPALASSAEFADLPRSQRNLTIALVLSLAIHAIVLSIHFRLPEALGRATERALDVILVNSKGNHKPELAQAKAQVNLDGGGNTDEDRRAKTPLPVSPRTQEGTDLIEAQKRLAELEVRQQQVLTALTGKKSIGSDVRSNRDPSPTIAPASTWRVWKARSRAISMSTTSVRARSSSAPASRNTASRNTSRTGARRSSASAISTIPRRPGASSTAAWC